MEPSNRTPAGDQYSLGCVLYYCLTGRVPFPEGSAVEKMMAHQTKEPEPLAALAPDAPPGLAAVVKRLMAKKPEERFAGCDEVVEALQQFAGDQRVTVAAAPAARSAGSQSGGRMPGLTTPPPSGERRPPAVSPRSAISIPVPGPGAGRVPTPPPLPSAIPPATRTPGPPERRPNMPSRAAFQIPPVADEMDAPPAAPAGRPAPPARRSMPSMPVPPAPAPGRGAKSVPAARPLPAPKGPQPPPFAEEIPTGWADDDAAATPRRSFGPIGLVAAALLLMVAVYLGATLLMKN
jgi:serine/threonine-protein kinase